MGVISSLVNGSVTLVVEFIKNKFFQNKSPENTGRCKEKTDVEKKPEISLSDIDYKLPDSFKQKGIVGIQCKNHEKVAEKVLKAKHSIKIISYYGDAVLNNLRKKLIEVIKANIEVRLLLAKKDSILIDEVLELEKTKKDYIKYEYVRKTIKEIKEATVDKSSRLTLRQYNTQARYALIVIDEEWAWWTPYHPGIITEESISFELENTGNSSFFHLCDSHFEKLWEISEEDNVND